MGLSIRVRALGLALAAPVGIGFAQQSANQAVDNSFLPYASTAQSAVLNSGRKIHLTCSGHGSPTVVLTAGGGDWSITWHHVQPEVSKRTRVCAWDRAGFGLSDASPEPQTVDHTTADLYAALHTLHIGGPYILVGHSQGAYESILFADQHRNEVRGMVLVDPSVPDQAARFARAVPAIYALTGPSSQHPFAKLMEECAHAIRSGEVRPDGPDPRSCLHPPPPPPDYPAPLRDALLNRSAAATPTQVAAAMDTIASSFSTFDKSSRIVTSTRRSYGAMPLIVLTAGDFVLPPGLPQSVSDEIPARQAEWRRAHQEYAALSSRGVERVVAGSGHEIQSQAPNAVITAIEEVLKASRCSLVGAPTTCAIGHGTPSNAGTDRVSRAWRP